MLSEKPYVVHTNYCGCGLQYGKLDSNIKYTVLDFDWLILWVWHMMTPQYCKTVNICMYIVCMYVCMYVHVCMYVCTVHYMYHILCTLYVCTCMYVCMYLHMYV